MRCLKPMRLQARETKASWSSARRSQPMAADLVCRRVSTDQQSTVRQNLVLDEAAPARWPSPRARQLEGPEWEAVCEDDDGSGGGR